MKMTDYFIFVVFLLVVLAGSEFIASDILKPAVKRLRPSHDPALSSLLHLVRDYRGGTYGFVSAHAANSASALVFIVPFVPTRLLRLFLLFALFFYSLSRVYLGVHYPGDLLAGWLVGSLWGLVVLLLLLHFLPNMKRIAANRQIF